MTNYVILDKEFFERLGKLQRCLLRAKEGLRRFRYDDVEALVDEALYQYDRAIKVARKGRSERSSECVEGR
jgi:hypothetical protein